MGERAAQTAAVRKRPFKLWEGVVLAEPKRGSVEKEESDGRLQ